MRAVTQVDLVDDRGRGGDDVDVEFTLDTLADDLEMQQPKETAAEAEAKCGRGFHVVGEARVVEAQPADGLAQVLEARRIDGKEAGEDHGLCRAEARQLGGRQVLFIDDGVTHTGVGHLLDRGGEEADFARTQLVDRFLLGARHADAFELVDGIGGHQPHPHALLQHAVDDAHQHDDAEIGIIPAVNQQRLQRRIAVALGGRQAVNDGFENVRHAHTGLGGNRDGV